MRSLDGLLVVTVCALLVVAGYLATLSLIWFHARLRERSWRRRWEICKTQAAGIVAGVKRQFPGCEGARNAITTDPTMRTGRSSSSLISEEDYVDALDRIDPAATPLLSFCDNEVKLNAIDRTWNVDSYPTPKGALGRGDAETAPASSSSQSRDWTANVRKMGNIAQGFSETWRQGWITEQGLPKVRGMGDTASYAKTSAYVMLKRHMEVAFGSFDQVAVYDGGANLGAVGAGYFKLVASANAYASVSAYAIGKPTDLHSAPVSAVVSGALTASHSRTMWKNVALALRTAAQQRVDWVLLPGLSLKQAISDLTDPSGTLSSASAGALARSADQVRVILANEKDSVLGAEVDVIRTPNGRFMVAETDWLGTTTTTSTGGALASVNVTTAQRASAAFVGNASAGIILKKGNLFKTWGVTPFTEELGRDGGGVANDSKCLALLGVRNPILAGLLNFTS